MSDGKTNRPVVASAQPESCEPAGITCGPTPQDHFTIVPNSRLRRHTLTWAEKGMLDYITSHVAGYDLTVEQIIAQGEDGPRAVRTILNGLERKGYLNRVRRRDAQGRLGRYRWAVHPDGPQRDSHSGRDQHVHSEPAGRDQSALSTVERPPWTAQPLEDQEKKTNAALVEDQKKGGKAPLPSPAPTPKPPTYVGRCPAHGDHPNPPPCGPCADARRAHQAQQATEISAQPHPVRCRVHLIDHAPNAECRSCRADRLAGDTRGRAGVLPVTGIGVSHTRNRRRQEHRTATVSA